MTESINSYNENGRTPLMEAALMGDGILIKSLLADGADPYLKDDNFGTSTALDIALRESKRNTEIDYSEAIQSLRDATNEHSPSNSEEDSNNESISSNNDILDYLNTISRNTARNSDVTITNVDIPFKDLIVFLTKLGFAAIPALIIIYLALMIMVAIVGKIT